jgi:hypothetical protein
MLLYTDQMLQAADILRLHDLSTAHGHDAATPAPVAPDAFAQLVLDQHQANFDLWHREDEARNPKVPDAVIAQVKHDIDRLNQLRNDLAEQIDLMLLDSAELNLDAPLHSESPGLIVDRLSILALKIFHTEEQIHRSTTEHQQRNRARLSVLNEQRDDLAGCLDRLWAEVLGGTRRFKLYRQLKMYNDPDLNPVLYGGSPPDAGTVNGQELTSPHLASYKPE